MDTLLIAILLVGFAILCFGIDLFMPTGGILLIVAAISAVIGLGFGFAHSAMTGGWLTVIVLIAIPITLAIFVKVYPTTALGKKMFIDRPQAVPYDYATGSNAHQLNIGDVGLAKTELHPSGKIRIDNAEFEAVSVTGIIPAGSSVIVTEIEMNVATVELYDAPVAFETLESSPKANSRNVSENENTNLLELPVDQFNLNDFDNTKDG